MDAAMLAIPRIPARIPARIPESSHHSSAHKKKTKSSHHSRKRMQSFMSKKSLPIERASIGKFFLVSLHFPLMIFIYLLFVDVLHFSRAQAHKLEQSWACSSIVEFWREIPLTSN